MAVKSRFLKYFDAVGVVKGSVFEHDLTWHKEHNIWYMLYVSTCFLGFAAIRLAVLDEPESDEEVIFNQQPRPRQTGWSLDTEDTEPKDKCHHHDNRRKSKVMGNAQSNVAFSSPLVRWSLSQIEADRVGRGYGFCLSWYIMPGCREPQWGKWLSAFCLLLQEVKSGSWLKATRRGPQIRLILLD